MKKILSALIVIAVMTALLSVSVGSASFTGAADNLLTMGLFIGTEKGYELEREPTRAEAAVMLTRLLGKEEYAKTLEYTAPFEDVPIWAKPYVQYLYSSDLTKGTSQTSYSPNQPCTLQMYATFLLRSLGYSDTNGDFSYAEAINFARSKSVINEYNCSDTEFLRDHVVAMSYTALYCPTADGMHSSLLDKLIEDGAVSPEAAASAKELFDYIRDYDAAVNGITANGTYRISNTYATSVTVGGEPYINNLLKQQIDVSLGKNSVESSVASVATDSMTEYSKYDAERHDDYSVYYSNGMIYLVDSEGNISTAESSFPNFISNYNSVDTMGEKLALILNSESDDERYILELTVPQTEIILNRILEDIQTDVDYSKVKVESFEYSIKYLPYPATKIHTVFSTEINTSVFKFDIVIDSELTVPDSGPVIPEFE